MIRKTIGCLFVCLLLMDLAGCAYNLRYIPKPSQSEKPITELKIGVCRFENQTDRRYFFGPDTVISPVEKFSESIVEAMSDLGLFPSAKYIDIEVSSQNDLFDIGQKNDVDILITGKVKRFFCSAGPSPVNIVAFPVTAPLALLSLAGPPTALGIVGIEVIYNCEAVACNTGKILWRSSDNVQKKSTMFNWVGPWTGEKIQTKYFSNALSEFCRTSARRIYAEISHRKSFYLSETGKAFQNNNNFQLASSKISESTNTSTSVTIQSPQKYTTNKRLALIIGNSNYPKGGSLPNPVNDARAISNALQSVGFDVMKQENLSQRAMKQAIDDFGGRLKGYGVGLFFYAGHGIQVKGNNYLMPSDAGPKSENQVEYDCIRADRVLAMMEDAGTNTNIIILDACRDNPFARSWSRSSSGAGLAFMNAPSGSLIAYSTAPGKTASDGAGANGLFTAALLQHIKTPGIKIEDVFKRVRATVEETSGGLQTPWESTSLKGDFYFNGE